jgi:protein TonB
MRLSLVSIPAAIITLLLFLTMQAMIASHDPRFVQQPSGRAVTFIDLTGLVRAGREGPTVPPGSPGTPPLEALPPLPDSFAPPIPRTPPASQAFAKAPAPAAVPELPLDLGGLTLPSPPLSAPPTPAKPPPARAATRLPPDRSTTAAATQRTTTPLDATGTAATPQPSGDTTAARVAPHGEPGAAAGLGTDTEARPLVRVEPDYPRKAARAGQEGWVKLAFTITSSGSVKDVVVLDAQPRRVFERSAQRALEQWRFQPQLVNGRPVPRQATQLIEFKLAGRG